MAILKDKTDIGDFMSGAQSNAVSQFISEHVGQEVNFTSVRATLPQLVSVTDSLVKVNNKRSGGFYACSEEGLSSFIQEVLEKQQTAHSFFDDMDSLVTDEVIGMSVLSGAEPRANEYSNEDVDALISLSQS